MKKEFRAEHVGSLLRPREVKEARAKRDKGEIGRGDALIHLFNPAGRMRTVAQR